MQGKVTGRGDVTGEGPAEGWRRRCGTVAPLAALPAPNRAERTASTHAHDSTQIDLFHISWLPATNAINADTVQVWDLSLARSDYILKREIGMLNDDWRPDDVLP